MTSVERSRRLTDWLHGLVLVFVFLGMVVIYLESCAETDAFAGIRENTRQAIVAGYYDRQYVIVEVARGQTVEADQLTAYYLEERGSSSDEPRHLVWEDERVWHVGDTFWLLYFPNARKDRVRVINKNGLVKGGIIGQFNRDWSAEYGPTGIWR